jgi:hypothetical protein
VTLVVILLGLMAIEMLMGVLVDACWVKVPKNFSLRSFIH